MLIYAEHVDAEKKKNLIVTFKTYNYQFIRSVLEVKKFSSEKLITYVVWSWSYNCCWHTKLKQISNFFFFFFWQHQTSSSGNESLRVKQNFSRSVWRETDLGVLDLRVGHRRGHQLEGCHESSGVALHLSGDLDLTGSHHCSLSARLLRLLVFSTDFWLGLWVSSWVYSQVSAAVHFHWAKKRAVLLKIKYTHLHKRPQPCVLRRRNTSTPPTTSLPVHSVSCAFTLQQLTFSAIIHSLSLTNNLLKLSRLTKRKVLDYQKSLEWVIC